MEWSLLGFRGLKQITNIHPAVVHFPIGLYPAALLMYLFGLPAREPAFLRTGRIFLFLAAASGLVTAWSGFNARQTISFNMKTARMVELHQTIGLLIGTNSAILVLWSLVSKRGAPRLTPLFVALLVFTNYLVLQNGDLGSQMVYTQGTGVRAPREAVPA